MANSSKTVGAMCFGPYELSLDDEELRKGGNRLKLTGQALQVLVVLANNAGSLVTREDLQQRLWPGATSGDFEHGLNAAVNRLRETLGDSATAPKYIETIPRRGYRFIAALEPPVIPTRPDPPREELVPQSPPWWKRRAILAAASCVVIGGSLYFWTNPRIEWLLRLYELQQLKVVPLTALPGNAWSPTFSPDGGQVAFIWDGGDPSGADLYVKIIGGDKPLRLTHDGFASRAAWSPDGRSIALWRQSPNGCEISLITPLGGPERRIVSASCSLPCAPWISWSPDGRQLAFLDHPADSPSAFSVGLSLLSLDSTEQALVKTDCDFVQSPAFSPRGDYLAWECADHYSNVSVHLQRLSDGRVTQLLQGIDGPGGMAWSRDGRRIFFSTPYSGGDLWEIALARPQHPEKLPIGHDAADIAVSPAGNRLAFLQSRRNVNIWRVDLSKPPEQARKVVSSSRRQTAPDISPAGNQIAFESTRSGSNEVWVSDSDGSDAVQLSSFGISQTGSPHWSPDGKLIAFDSRVGGEANIYIVDPQGGVPRKLAIDIRGNSTPSWSHDGNWIYFTNGEDSPNVRVWKVRSEGGHAVQVTRHEGFNPLESPDGRHVFFSHELRLWRVGIDGTEEQQVQGMPQLGNYGEVWSPFGSGIYFLRDNNGRGEIEFFDLSTKSLQRIFVLEKPLILDWMGGLPVSSNGKWLLFSQVDEQSGDLMMIENWR